MTSPKGNATVVWLIGMRGAGKSFVGRELSTRFGWELVDTDALFPSGTADYIDRYGMNAFRNNEQAILWELSLRAARGEKLVVATGGGFVDWAPSREIVALAKGEKLFLNPPAEALWERLRGQEERLKIGHLTTFAAFRDLLEKRRPFFEKISTAACETQDISEILLHLKSRGI